jgi:hypothetical protein
MKKVLIWLLSLCVVFMSTLLLGLAMSLVWSFLVTPSGLPPVKTATMVGLAILLNLSMAPNMIELHKKLKSREKEPWEDVATSLVTQVAVWIVVLFAYVYKAVLL